MKQDDLMRYARELGVEIRQAGPNGKKTKWRAVDYVKKDCKAAQARLCQPSQENEPLEASAVDTLKNDDLMGYAKELGVETRQAGPNGEKTHWRAVVDVKKDCKAAQAWLCQPSQENEPIEASVEASSSSRAAPLPAPERAPSVEGGVDNKYAVRHAALNLGPNQRGYTKAELEAKLKDATSGQQTLASA